MGLDKDGWRIHDEVEHHLEELTTRLEAEGYTREEARAEALRRFGDPDGVARATRAVDGRVPRTGGGWLAGDLRHAVRGLLRTPAFTGSVVLTLALALGATLSVLGVVWDVLLRPLDVREPDAWVALTERMPESGIEASPTSEGTFQDWKRDLTTVRDVVGYEWLTRTLEDPERPAELLSVEVSGDFFRAMGIEPALGRVFTAADEAEGGTAAAVMLSWALWQSRFGGDPLIVGRTLPIEGIGREVVGIAPERLDLLPDAPALFIPDVQRPWDPTNRGGRTVHAFARLAPGASVAQATAEIARVTETIAETYPTSARGWSAAAVPLREHLLGDARRPILVALAGVALLLLVGVVNVANLLQVRAEDRRREMAVRAALGAGTARLLRLGLLEASVLGALGGAGGLALAWGVRTWLTATEPGVLPRALDGGPPALLVVAALVIAAVAALAVGAVPAVRGAQAAVDTLGRGMAGGRTRFSGRSRRVLVVAQLAFTAVLLVGAGLLIRTVLALRAVDVGYDPAGVVAARVPFDDPDPDDSREELQVYFSELLERVRALPGVQAAGITSALPMDPVAANFDLPVRSGEMEGLDWGEAPQADFRIVGPGLMEALGFRVLSGRTLTEDDRDGRFVAVVNRTLAEQFWSGEEAVGKRIQSVWRRDVWSEVVGVVEDTRFYGPAQASRPEIFVPHAQNSWSFMTVAVRSTRPAAEMRSELERAVVASNPLLPPQEVFDVASLVDATTSSERFYASLLAGFAALALALAAAGVYGTLAYTVRLRTREMGVRLALGARRGSVVGLVVGEGVLLAALGVGLGLAVSAPATRLVSGMLFGVRPIDPLTLAAVTTLLVAVALAACVAPAVRAARLDPVRVLRDE